jgi:hypothetical protein
MITWHRRSASPASALPPSVKAAYGFGMAAEGVKQSAFSVFLLFSDQQIVASVL